MRLLVIPILSAIATDLLGRPLDNRMDDGVRFGDFNVLQRQLQLGELLLVIGTPSRHMLSMSMRE